LQNYGAQVTESANGSNSIELIKKQSFDVVLMDIQMPGINGFDATRAIRKSGYNYPVIALTAQAIKGEREKCIAAGMDDYITKPINEEEFLSMLDKWIKHSHPSTNLTNTMSEQQLYDLSSLKTISRGNETFMQKMVKIFCEQTPIMLKEMDDARLVNDLDKISRAAHQMKPSIDNLNIVLLKQVVRDIENAGNEDVATLHQKIDRLKTTLLAVINKLKTEYPA